MNPKVQVWHPKRGLNNRLTHKDLTMNRKTEYNLSKQSWLLSQRSWVDHRWTTAVCQCLSEMRQPGQLGRKLWPWRKQKLQSPRLKWGLFSHDLKKVRLFSAWLKLKIWGFTLWCGSIWWLVLHLHPSKAQQNQSSVYKHKRTQRKKQSMKETKINLMSPLGA